MNQREIEEITLREDIVPMGRFEAIPVHHIRSAQAHDYPNVVVIKPLPQIEDLKRESVAHLATIGKKYLKERAGFLDPRISPDDHKRYLASLGFGKDQYQSFSLRKLGTNQLEDFVGPVTREFFETLGVPTFRQQHTMSSNGWKTKLHRDHEDFTIHGFRGMVPLNAPVYLGYVGPRGENLVYRLDPGHLYFANIAKYHRGFAVQNERVAIMFQMASDQLVIAPESHELEPLTDLAGIPESMQPYEY